MEDTGSLAVNLCLVSESGTLTFPVDISVTSTAISATGMITYYYNQQLYRARYSWGNESNGAEILFITNSVNVHNYCGYLVMVYTQRVKIM